MMMMMMMMGVDKVIAMKMGCSLFWSTLYYFILLASAAVVIMWHCCYGDRAIAWLLAKQATAGSTNFMHAYLSAHTQAKIRYKSLPVMWISVHG